MLEAVALDLDELGFLWRWIASRDELQMKRKVSIGRYAERRTKEGLTSRAKPGEVRMALV